MSGIVDETRGAVQSVPHPAGGSALGARLAAWMFRLAQRRVAGRRPPDFVVGGDAPYLRRWWVLPKNRWCNVYLHHFCRSDDDRALHDHPWAWNASWLLAGSYLEHTPGGAIPRSSGSFVFRRGPAPHRVALHRTPDGGEATVWTMFLTGPKVREWGFLCPRGWRHWQDFVSVTPNGNDVGRGCAD